MILWSARQNHKDRWRDEEESLRYLNQSCIASVRTPPSSLLAYRTLDNSPCNVTANAQDTSGRILFGIIEGRFHSVPTSSTYLCQGTCDAYPMRSSVGIMHDKAS